MKSQPIQYNQVRKFTKRNWETKQYVHFCVVGHDGSRWIVQMLDDGKISRLDDWQVKGTVIAEEHDMQINQIREWVYSEWKSKGFFVIVGKVPDRQYVWLCKNLATGEVYREWDSNIIQKSLVVSE